jgi:hypothetical protein
MAIPTSPCVAMFRGEPQDAQADARRRILTMTGLAGHAGLPQINIPYSTRSTAPPPASPSSPARAATKCCSTSPASWRMRASRASLSRPPDYRREIAFPLPHFIKETY